MELKSVEKVIEKLQKVLETKIFSPKKGKHCDWCDYKTYYAQSGAIKSGSSFKKINQKLYSRKNQERY